MSRLKWLPMQHGYLIYEKAIEAKHRQKESNIKSQFDLIDKIEARARSLTLMTQEVESELHDILTVTMSGVTPRCTVRRLRRFAILGVATTTAFQT